MKKKLIADSEKLNSKEDKNSKEISSEKYFKWVHDNYTEQIPKCSHKTDYYNGMLKRVFNISTMKYAVLPNMLYGNTVVFKLYDIVNRKETNYAMLFCEDIGDLPDKMKKNIYTEQIVGQIVIQHYSTSSSFISCDGEYRSKFTRYSDFIKAKYKYPDIWNEIDTYVMRISEKRQWSITPIFFHGKTTDNNNELERIIKNNLIPQIFLAMAWFHTVYNEVMGLTESHINEDYKYIFFSNIKTDTIFIKELIKKYGEQNVELFKIYTSHIVEQMIDKSFIRYIPLGYKMIPLNLREIQYPLKINCKPWREHAIASKCSDLVINQIAPGFAITLDWFLIKKTHKGLFDNKSQYERMKHSELAKGILNLLYEAQRSTYFVTGKFDSKQSKDHIKQWINSKFKKLNNKLNDSTDYLLKDIIMSDVTLSFPSEFVGRTISDTISLSHNKLYQEKIHFPFKNYNIFAKYMFEICYSILAINKSLGIIHGDLHLNNATIGYLYNPLPNSSIIYQIDELKYIFPNTGYFSCIIDFSRSFVIPENYELFTDHNIPSFKIINDYDEFFINEVNNILHWYLQLFPNKNKNKEELIVIFKNNFNAVFKLLTAMDIFMFTTRLSAMLNQQDNVNKKCIELVDNINKMSEFFITNEMNILIKNTDYSKQIDEMPFPIETIITKHFSEFLTTCDSKNSKSNEIIISDYYVLNNPLNKSLNIYDLFPDVIKYSKYYDDNNIIDMEKIIERKRITREQFEKRKLHSIEHLKFLAHKYTNL